MSVTASSSESYLESIIFFCISGQPVYSLADLMYTCGAQVRILFDRLGFVFSFCRSSNQRHVLDVSGLAEAIAEQGRSRNSPRHALYFFLVSSHQSGRFL